MSNVSEQLARKRQQLTLTGEPVPDTAAASRQWAANPLSVLRQEFGGAVVEVPIDPALQRDPRPDLARDSRLWPPLFRRACVAGREDLACILHGIRCEGAELRQDAEGTLHLWPGTIPAPEWREICARYLAPHRKAVLGLLGRGP